VFEQNFYHSVPTTFLSTLSDSPRIAGGMKHLDSSIFVDRYKIRGNVAKYHLERDFMLVTRCEYKASKSCTSPGMEIQNDMEIC